LFFAFRAGFHIAKEMMKISLQHATIVTFSVIYPMGPFLHPKWDSIEAETI